MDLYQDVLERLSGLKHERKVGEDIFACTSALLGKLRDGKKLSHEERFNLTAYLINTGWNDGKIAKSIIKTLQ